MPIKSFRGLIDSEEVETIRLSTQDGMTGYRIVKFQVIQEQPGTQDTESTVTVSKIPFTPDTKIDLSNPSVLAVAFYGGPQIASAYPIQNVIIFDQEIVNQDIYVGTKDSQGKAMNYYIELEQIRLNENSQSVATLRDIRANTS